MATIAAKIVQDLHFTVNISYSIFCIKPSKVGLRYTFDFNSERVYHCVLESLKDSRFELLQSSIEYQYGED